MATVNSPQSSSSEKVSGAVRVIMPDQTGSFQVNSTRGAVQKVQVVDVDMVLHMADGTKVVLAGGAMEAMDDKSKVKFSDTSADTGKLLDTVGKIPLAPNDQSRVLNSDPIAAADRTASSEVDPQVQQHAAGDRNSAATRSDSISQLAKIISDNSGSLTTSGNQNLSLQTKPTATDSSSASASAAISASQGTNDSPVKQIDPQLPPERPGTIPSTHVVGPSAPTIAVKLVNLTTVTQSGATLYGSGGTPPSATDAALPIQFATQVINAGDDVRTIYAVGNNQNLFTKVFNVAISGDGTVLTMTVAGVPAGMSVVNGTSLGNGAYQITVAAGQKEFNLQLQYSTAIADSSSPVHQAFDLTFTTSIATSDGVLSLTDTRHVAVKDASSYNDLIYLDPATGDSVLVLPAQGTPHEVHAGNGGVTIYGSNANDFLYGGTGNDIMIGGSGNTYFEGGAGADIITGGVGGINTVGYVNSTSGVTVNLVTGAGTRGDAEGDQLTNIQNVKGSSYDDIIIANAAANRIDGGAGGSDTVSYQASTSAVTVNLITASGSGGYAAGDVYAHIQNVIGSQYNDLFIANGEANRFDGGGGSDTVSYANSSAAVTVNLLTGTGSGGAAEGDSYVRIQNVIGSAYDDVFVGSADANAFDGGSGGNDTVSYAGSSAGVQVNFVSGRGTGGNAEGDTYIKIQNVIGSAFDDVFVAGIDSKHFDGGSGGSDTVNYGGSTGAVTVNMITLSGSGGYAQGNTYANIQNIVGSSYSDTFIASAAANNFNGGLGGSDTVSYAFSNAGVTVDLYNGTGSGGYAQGDVLAHIQNVIGGDYDDLFIASADTNNFSGGGGSNTVSYQYSTGAVTIDLTNTIGTGTGGYYAAGDSFTNIQNIIGSVYDDLFVASADANRFDGGTGSVHNRVSYAASDAGVTVDLNRTDGTGTFGGYAQGDSLVNVQDLTGSAFDDTFVASAAANSFDGGAGSNRVSYSASNAAVSVDLVTGLGSGGYAQGDTYTNIQNVTGSDGDDLFIANNQANDFKGGLGNNTVSYAKASDATGVTVNLFTGRGLNGFADGDTYADIQNVIGTSYDDLFIANNIASVFDGHAGNDTVSYVNSNASVTVDLTARTGSGGFAAGDRYLNIQSVVGGQYDDIFYASSDANVLDGGAGIAGVASHNRVDYSYSNAAVTVDLNFANGSGTSGGYAQGDVLKNIQDVTGSQYDDTFIASLDANNFDGGANITGVASHNRVSYAASNANVTIDLGTANGIGTGIGGYAQGDRLTNIQDITGSQFDDVFIASAAANNFDGGANIAGVTSHNRISYVNSTASVTIDLGTANGIGLGTGGWAEGDRLTNIQDITGSQYDDTFIASAAANNFDGGANITGVTSHNRVSYVNSTANVSIDLGTADGIGLGTGGWAQDDRLTNIQDITGSQYDDLFIASAAANSFDGGANIAGIDSHNRVSYANSSANVTIDLGTANGVGTGTGGWADGDRLTNIQDVTGSQYDDTFIASAAANNFDGGANIAGVTSHNRVSYANSTSNVTIDLGTADGIGIGSGGWAAGDRLTNIQDITGSQYDDTFVASAAANTFDGGANIAGVTSHNRVSYANSSSNVTIDLGTADGIGLGGGGWAQDDRLINIQDITGSQYDDLFIASAAANNFDGGANITGVTSHNRVSYANSTGNVTIDLGTANGVGVGTGAWAAGDRLTNIQDITGSQYDDTFVASAAANTFDGGTNITGVTSHNRVSYANSTAAVNIDLSPADGIGLGTGGWAEGDRLINIQDITGSKYNDTFIASAAANNFDGGINNTDGSDPHNRVSYVGSNAAVVVNLAGATGTGSGGWAAGDTYVNIQDVTGSQYDDIFIAGAATNAFDGGVANSDGSDSHNVVSYVGSNAAVVVDLSLGTGAGGWAGGDTYVRIQDVVGSQYNDEFVASGDKNNFDGGANLSGLTAHNRVNYRDSNAAVTVDLSTTVGTGSGGWAAGDTYTNIQDATGSQYNDTFIASAAANNFDGGANMSGLTAHNRVSYQYSDVGVTVDLSTSTGTGSGGWAAGDTFINIQDATGSAVGNSTFIASAAANSFDGFQVNNTVSYANGTVGGVNVNLSGAGMTGTGSGNWAAGDVYTNIQHAIGTSFADTLTGVSVAGVRSVLLGGGGADTIVGIISNREFTYASYSTSTTGVKIDLANGTGAAVSGTNEATGDILINISNVIGGSGDDIFIASNVSNKFEGGAGLDTVSYVNSNVGVTVNLTSGTGTNGWADADNYISIENVIGSNYNDVLTGSSVGGTRSWLNGGTGNDTLVADAGNRGTTYANYSGQAAAVTVHLDTQYTEKTGGASDTLIRIDNVIGSGLADLYYASIAANKFEANGGNVTVTYANQSSAAVVNGAVTTFGVSVDLTNGVYANNTAVTDGTGTKYGWAEGDYYTGVRNVVGTGFDDIFYANNLANRFDGGSGGSDTVSYSRSGGSVSVDLLAGTGSQNYASNDTYFNISNVVGSSYDDKFFADIHANSFTGGGGNDTVSYLNSGNSIYSSSRTSTDAITVNLTSGLGIGGDAAGDHYSGIRNIEGSAFANSTLVGDSGANTLTAQGNSTTNVLMGLGAGSGTDVYDVRLGGSNTVTVGSGNNLILATAKNSDHLVNINTGTTNIANIDGSAGNTNLTVYNVTSTFDLSQFSTNVSGITTLDLTSGNGTIISLSGTDVQHIGQVNATTHVSTLNLRASQSELVSITSATNSYLIEVSTGDYLFYSDSSKTTQIARLHVIKV